MHVRTPEASCPHLEKFCCTVIRGGQDILTIRGEGSCIDMLAMTLERALAHSGLNAEQPDATIVRGCQNPAPVKREGYRMKGELGTLKSTLALPGLQVEEPGTAI